MKWKCFPRPPAVEASAFCFHRNAVPASRKRDVLHLCDGPNSLHCKVLHNRCLCCGKVAVWVIHFPLMNLLKLQATDEDGGWKRTRSLDSQKSRFLWLWSKHCHSAVTVIYTPAGAGWAAADIRNKNKTYFLHICVLKVVKDLLLL